MAKRPTRPKSAEFARWVRSARSELGKSQAQVAAKARIRQQHWSKIESDGVIPPDDALARLCDALKKDKSEAKEVISGTRTVDDRVQLYQQDWLQFFDSVVKRANRESATNPRSRPTQLFVIREDSAPVDRVVVGMHCDLMSRAEHLRVSVLFRYGIDKVWESFRWLAGSLAEEWVDRGHDLEKLRARFRGFYRHSSFEEDRSLSLPMVHPLVLLVDSMGPTLYYYDVNPEVFARQQQAGLGDPDAQRHALVVLPAWREQAKLIAGWVGSQSMLGVDPDRWHEIDWPPLNVHRTPFESGLSSLT